MKRKAVRNVTVGALASGLVPLVGAGFNVQAAEADAGGSPVALCRSTFGAEGPVGGSIVGEGPPGDPMTVTIGWDTTNWPEGIREAITCIGVGGQSDFGLTRSSLAPPNTGNLIVDLMLPPGPAGSLVCQQTLLVGKGSVDGLSRKTDPVCFKLRAAEEMIPDDAARNGQPSSRRASAVKIPGDVRTLLPGGEAANPGPTATSSSTPPARASFEAARGAVRSPQAWSASPGRPAPALAPTAPVTLPGQAPDELARTPLISSPVDGSILMAMGRTAGTTMGRTTGEVRAAPTGRSAASATSAASVAAAAPKASTAAGAETVRSALPHTGVGDKIPLAGAGTLLALGGAAMILGEPRRRGARRLPA